jgi:hypothetical protein
MFDGGLVHQVTVLVSRRPRRVRGLLLGVLRCGVDLPLAE